MRFNLSDGVPLCQPASQRSAFQRVCSTSASISMSAALNVFTSERGSDSFCDLKHERAKFDGDMIGLLPAGFA